MQGQGIIPHKKAEVASAARSESRSFSSLILVVAVLLAMAIVNIFTEASAPFKDFVHSIGKLWIPGAQGIGPYSGKETTLLVVWLGAWAILHFALRKRDLPIKPWAIGFLVAVGVATTLLWPPVFGFLTGA